MSSRPKFLLALVGVLAMAFAMVSPSRAAAVPTGGAENGTRLMAGVALYPRVIRLTHSGTANGAIIAGVVTFDASGGVGAIFRSTDNGRTFSRIGSVRDPGAAHGLCCATLYELPRRVGDLAAGTLLWSASVGQDAGDQRRMTLPLWASSDHGRSWRRLAVVATSPNFGGLWEPELTVAKDGRLVLFVSDESRQPAHSQLLDAATSAYGTSWTALHYVVAAQDPRLRPGMPNVRRLPSGGYLMSYEVCGPGQDCRQRVRHSPDGIRWGDPTDLGAAVKTADGTHFRHAPTISWYADGSGNGRLLAVGQMLYDSDGAIEAGNGSTVLSTGGSAQSDWTQAPAPVRILAPYDNYCPNYSSSLLPMPETGTLLELATGYDDSGTCTTYFASGPLPR
ncbi:sialidase family protein [Microlunatus sp. Gsoil 973]|uniref:sialidase family protein n=1 Tax=Microlunatus sp. Gsoil 973 TaxID=2672569 RepID=UPI0012B44833|nr:sialidase family protein [Microlunatus sp. Gsoil 973]QGN34557.1 exo-alpha-sialidase [Microlunatus sp. Gsoil 973]